MLGCIVEVASSYEGKIILVIPFLWSRVLAGEGKKLIVCQNSVGFRSDLFARPVCILVRLSNSLSKRVCCVSS